MSSCFNNIYKDKRVLVTGVTGFKGSWLSLWLDNLGAEVLGISLESQYTNDHFRVANLEKKINSLVRDIRNYEDVYNEINNFKPEFVFHFAAQTSAYVANADPQADLDANVTPLVRMLDACRADGVKPTIMFAGTATQAGLQNETQVNETAQDLPVTAYDINKLAGEKHLQRYTGETGVPTVTLRLANVYGPGTNVGSGDRGFLNLMVK